MPFNKNNKYSKLYRWLKRQTGDDLPVTFDDVSIICGGLPATAYTRSSFWVDNGPNGIAQNWVAAGFTIKFFTFRKQTLRFVRVGSEYDVERRFGKGLEEQRESEIVEN